MTMQGLDAFWTWEGFEGSPYSLPGWWFDNYVVLDQQVENDTILYVNTTNDSSNVSSIEAIKVVNRVFSYPNSSPEDPEYDLPTIINLIPPGYGTISTTNEEPIEISGNLQLALARMGIFNLDNIEGGVSFIFANKIFC